MKDPRTEIGLGIALFLASTYLIYDAYEGRGRKRPFLARFLP
jgi:hypothetical protein